MTSKCQTAWPNGVFQLEGFCSSNMGTPWFAGQGLRNTVCELSVHHVDCNLFIVQSVILGLAFVGQSCKQSFGGEYHFLPCLYLVSIEFLLFMLDLQGKEAASVQNQVEASLLETGVWCVSGFCHERLCIQTICAPL